ncbi:hypothetical protein TEA_016062 [Camellia sinensis var. sinensis]|uniref:RRM domain-containing protein n=1 Tax=Camellia sinensis var. sinensis TaxID=542762 RepID=A0A4V3WNU6_CAMSN|nr:hypothetical protein TEA_016062 [Camellia sinensis var. sinensis]
MAYQSIPGTGSGLQFLNYPFGDTTYTKVFVGGLAWETQSETLRRHFEQYGQILEAVVITDKHTGRSKGLMNDFQEGVSVNHMKRGGCVFSGLRDSKAETKHWLVELSKYASCPIEENEVPHFTHLLQVMGLSLVRFNGKTSCSVTWLEEVHCSHAIWVEEVLLQSALQLLEYLCYHYSPEENLFQPRRNDREWKGVTFCDPESAKKACVDPNPVIDGRRANCNLASLGRPQPALPYGRLRSAMPYFGIHQMPRGAYIGSPSIHQPVPFSYQPGVAYPPYGYTSFGPEYAYPQGVYNPHMGQHYLQIYGVPGTVNTNIVPYGQMGHPLSGNHGYPTIQGYVTPGRHVLQYGGPLVSGVTTDTIATTQAPYLAGIPAPAPGQARIIMPGRPPQFIQSSGSDQMAGRPSRVHQGYSGVACKILSCSESQSRKTCKFPSLTSTITITRHVAAFHFLPSFHSPPLPLPPSTHTTAIAHLSISFRGPSYPHAASTFYLLNFYHPHSISPISIIYISPSAPTPTSNSRCHFLFTHAVLTATQSNFTLELPA